MQTKIYRVPTPRRQYSPFAAFIYLVAALMLATALMVGVHAETAQSFGGTKGLTEDKPKPSPDSVTLPADVVRGLTDAAKDQEIAKQRADNLGLQIELAKAQLEKLQKAASDAKDASNAAFRAACVKAGIPAPDVDQYEGQINDKGEMVLTRKKVSAPPK